MSSRSASASLERLYLGTRRLPLRRLPDVVNRATALSAGSALLKRVDQSILGFLIATDQVANVVAGIGVASGLYLRLHPILQGIGERYVHGRHHRLAQLAHRDDGKSWQSLSSSSVSRLQHLKHLQLGTAGRDGADADGDDAVEPGVLLRSCFEDRRGAKVEIGGRHRLAAPEPRHGVGAAGEDAAIVGVDEVAVIGAQGAAHVQFNDTVCALEQPVAARDQYLAAQLRPLEAAALERNHHAVTARSAADIEGRPDLEPHAVEQLARQFRHRRISLYGFSAPLAPT